MDPAATAAAWGQSQKALRQPLNSPSSLLLRVPHDAPRPFAGQRGEATGTPRFHSRPQRALPLSPAPLPPRAPSAARAPPAGVVVRCELPPPGRRAVPATPHRLPGRAEPVPRMGRRATPWPGLRGVLEACVPPYALGERPCLSPFP